MTGAVVICCGGTKVEPGFGTRVTPTGVVFSGGTGVVGGDRVGVDSTVLCSSCLSGLVP